MTDCCQKDFAAEAKLGKTSFGSGKLGIWMVNEHKIRNV
jgi:hypothetical protein